MGGPGGPSLGDLDCRTATACIKGQKTKKKTHLLEESRHVFMVFVHGLLLFCGLNWLVISH